VLEVEVVLRERRPGQREDPFEVRADDAVFRGGRGQLLEPPKFAVDRLTRLLRQLAEGLDPLAELCDLRLVRVVLAELLLDRLQLLAQEVLALAFLHLGLDLRLDLRAELEDLQLAVEDCGNRAKSLLDVDLRQDLLAFLGLDRAQRRRDEVAEGARVVDVRGGQLQLLGQVRREADDAREEALDVARQRFELRRLEQHVGQRAELAEQVWVGVEAVEELHALEALHEDSQRSVGNLDHLVHEGDRPDLVDVAPARRFDRSVARRDECEQPIAGDDVVDQPHRPFLADRERRHRLREDDRLLQRQHRQRCWELQLVLVGLRGVERDVRHARSTTIAIRPAAGGCSTTGRSIVSTPCSKRARARAGSTSSVSRTCRSNAPYSISICW